MVPVNRSRLLTALTNLLVMRDDFVILDAVVRRVDVILDVAEQNFSDRFVLRIVPKLIFDQQ